MTDAYLNGGKVGDYTWEKIGTAGNAQAVITLPPGKAIVVDGGSMIWVEEGIVASVTAGAWYKRFFTQESLFQTIFTNQTNAPKDICLGDSFIGDIIAIPVENGETWKLSPGTFMASSPGIVVEGSLNITGLIPIGQNPDSIVLTSVTNNTGSRGVVWITAFGVAKQHDLAASKTLLVDNEHFLCAPKPADRPLYTVATIGKLKTAFFSGEGFAMRFVGQKFYTQSNGRYKFARKIKDLSG